VATKRKPRILFRRSPASVNFSRVTKFFFGALIAAVLCGCASDLTLQRRFTYEEPQMGLPFRIQLYARDQQSADAAAKAAYARISELNSKLSDYDADSELVKLSQTAGKHQAVRVSDDLWFVLQRAQALAKETGGAFDVTCGPVVSQWRRARREKKLPDPKKLEEFRRAVGYEKLKLDARNHTAELLVPYMRLDLGAIAKGFAADEALKVLRAHGIRSALVRGGGDMAAGDAPPGRRGWRIELPPLDASNAPPTEFVWLANRGLATSGDLFQRVEIDGVRYSHIVDPRTGIGLTDHSLVVVIAKDGITADSLSTAISVLGPENGLALAKRHDACGRIVRKPDERIELRESECFRKFLQ
jgi:thiamine biosynthesis lipoprotein